MLRSTWLAFACLFILQSGIFAQSPTPNQDYRAYGIDFVSNGPVAGSICSATPATVPQYNYVTRQLYFCPSSSNQWTAIGGGATNVTSNPSGICPSIGAQQANTVAGTYFICTGTTPPGTWSQITGASGIADPGSNGLLVRNALNTTRVAALSDITALFTGATGSGTVVQSVSPTITTPTLTNPTISGTCTGCPNTTLPNSAALLGTNSGGSALAVSTLPTSTFPAVTGDVSIASGTTTSSVTKIGGNAVSLGGAFSTSGANAVVLTTTGPTAITLPTTGVLETQGNKGAVSGYAGLDSSAHLLATNFPAVVGDLTNTAGTDNFTVAKIGGNAVSLGGALSFAGAFATSVTVTAPTTITLPASGTLETQANKGASNGYPGLTGGLLANAVIPAPTVSALGGILALSSSTASNYLTYIDATGTQHFSQPGFGNLSGVLSSTQFPAVSGDVTISAGTTTASVTKIGGNSVSLGGALSFGGAFNTAFTVTGATALTLPTSGTLATTAGNVATATALAALPTPCSGGQAATGILANGNSTGCFTPTSGATTPATSSILKGNGSANGVVAATAGTDYVIPSGNVATATSAAGLNGTALSGLATGILKNTTATGVPVIATAGTDYVIPSGTVANATNATTATTATNFSGSLAGDVTGPQGSSVVGRINGVALSGLSTGLLKNTTSTGVPSIATAGTDYVSSGAGTTFGAFTYDFTSSTFKVPNSAGAAPTTSGLLAYDTTNNIFKGGFGGTAGFLPYFTGSFPTSGHCTSWGSLGLLTDSGGTCGTTLPSGNAFYTIGILGGATTGTVAALQPDATKIGRNVVTGCAGVSTTDDTPLFTAAFATAVVPEVFVASDNICYVNIAMPSGMRLIGVPGKSTLRAKTVGSPIIDFLGTSTTSPRQDAKVEGLVIDATGMTSGALGAIHQIYCQNCEISNVKINSSSGVNQADGIFSQSSTGRIVNNDITGMVQNGIEVYNGTAPCLVPAAGVTSPNWIGGNQFISGNRVHDLVNNATYGGDGIYVRGGSLGTVTSTLTTYVPSYCDEQTYTSLNPASAGTLALPSPQINSTSTSQQTLAPGWSARYQNISASNITITVPGGLNLNGTLNGTMTLLPGTPGDQTTCTLVDQTHYACTVINEQASGTAYTVLTSDFGTEREPGILRVTSATAGFVVTFPQPVAATAATPVTGPTNGGFGAMLIVQNATANTVTITTPTVAITGAANYDANHITITVNTTGFYPYQTIVIAGVGGCTNANGTFSPASGYPFTATSFVVAFTGACNASYTSGGTIQIRAFKNVSTGSSYCQVGGSGASNCTANTIAAGSTYVFFANGSIYGYKAETWMNPIRYVSNPAVVTGNFVSNIQNKTGNSGQTGNGIHVFNADGAIITGNTVTGTIYSGFRSSSAGNLIVAENNFSNISDSCLYSEYRGYNQQYLNNNCSRSGGGYQITNFDPNQSGNFAGSIQNVSLNGGIIQRTYARSIYVEGGSLVTNVTVLDSTGCGVQIGGNVANSIQIVNNYFGLTTFGGADPASNYFTTGLGQTTHGAICIDSLSGAQTQAYPQFGGNIQLIGNTFDSRVFNVVNGGLGTFPPVTQTSGGVGSFSSSTIGNSGYIPFGVTVQQQAVPFASISATYPPTDGSNFTVPGSQCGNGVLQTGTAITTVNVLNGSLTCSGATTGTFIPVSTTGTVLLSPDTALTQYLAPTGAVTTLTFPNGSYDGERACLLVVQGGTGYAVSGASSSVKGFTSPSATANLRSQQCFKWQASLSFWLAESAGSIGF